MSDSRPTLATLPRTAELCERPKGECPWWSVRHFHTEGWVLAPGEMIW